MNELPPSGRGKRHLPFELVVLGLQGGGALGSYQAGAFAALDEAEIPLDWLCGVSIGGINAALIVGNPPQKRVARLKEFWSTVATPPVPIPSFLERWGEGIELSDTILYGAPGFFVPRLNAPIFSTAGSPEGVSYYDTSPLEATLEQLVDLDLINSKPKRLTLGASNVQTGEPVYFDNVATKITAAHIMASAALPPAFPAVKIDGQYYWDGGVVSNSPMQFVADSRPVPRSALVFQVDLWDPNGELPLDITAATLRSLEIHCASRINVSFEEFRERQRARRALARLLEHAPESLRRDPDFQLLKRDAQATSVSLVRLRYRTKDHETGSKIFEFSRRTMEERWQAGYEDTLAALSEPGVLELPDEKEAARLFDVHTGWVH